MGFRFGLMVGIAVGYVLGARAGRARYEQIVAGWQRLVRSEPAQQVGAEARDAAARAGQSLSEQATGRVAKVTEMVRGHNGERRS